MSLEKRAIELFIKLFSTANQRLMMRRMKMSNYDQERRRAALRVYLLAAFALTMLLGLPSTAQSQWATSGNNISSTNTGNVGVGTSSPASKLQVVGTQGTVGAATFQLDTSTVFSSWTGAWPAFELVNANTTTNNVSLFQFSDSPSGASHAGIGAVNTNHTSKYGNLFFYTNQADGYQIRMGIYGGNVGIGTTSPDMPLTIKAQAASTNGFNLKNAALTYNLASLSSRGSGGAALDQGFVAVNDAGVAKVVLDSAGSSYFLGGNVGIGTTTPATKLDVNGDTNITGNLTITGNINARYQDVAEWVPANHSMPAGTVVTLNPTQSNQVMASTKSYDTGVAGVVSERPGLSLGEAGKDKVLVATTGRVKVKVDATRAAIHVGDLLVTSDVEGVAMKSEPLMIQGRPFHSPGTLIGKALEPLEKGTGEILVLLSLQ
jgi:hypothetical protein